MATKKTEAQAEFEEIEKFEAETKPALKAKTESKSKSKAEDKKSVSSAYLLVWFLICGLVISNIYAFSKCSQLDRLVHQSRKVYIYNMENALMMAGMAEENQQFEIELGQLEKDIDASNKKLATIKDKKLKEEYQDMYMKSLKIKRDDLIKKHEKFVVSISKNVNKALQKVAEKNKAVTIFASRAISVTTTDVIDVTPQVAEILKSKMDK